jgi:hypothetical protein
MIQKIATPEFKILRESYEDFFRAASCGEAQLSVHLRSTQKHSRHDCIFLKITDLSRITAAVFNFVFAAA